MKRNLMKLNAALCLLLIHVSTQAGSGYLFNVTATGTPANISITLCLNATAQLSCQIYQVSALSLSISTVLHNHRYPDAGIKINTPGYVPNFGCTPLSNGFCSFSVSDTSVTTVIINNVIAPNFTAWTEYPSDPVYNPVPIADIQQEDDYFPSVIYNANKFDGHGDAILYKMWSQGPLVSGNPSLSLSYSNDGIHWTLQSPPVIIDPSGAYHASVIYDKNGFGNSGVFYKMWYWTGNPGMIPPALEIKYAESIDGVTWTTPVATTQDTIAFLASESPPGPGSPFYQLYGFGTVIYNSNATSMPGAPFSYPYVAFFDASSAGIAPTTYEEEVGLAFSQDGLFWTRYGIAPVLIPSGNVADWDGLYAYRASVLTINGVMHMFFSGSNNDSTLQYGLGIGHASSTDGIHWTQDPGNPIFFVTNPGEAWRSGRTFTPSVVAGPPCLNNPSFPQLQMWFSGGTNDLVGGTFASAAIGYATMHCPQ